MRRSSLFAEDRLFITQREGGLRRDAYIPLDKAGRVIGKSGVTVGGGVDLGQHGEEDLRAAGVPEALIGKLAPYLGLKGEQARRFLDTHPLRLSDAEARTLTQKVHDRIIRTLAARFDAASDIPFAELPAPAQTVIADLAIQFGPYLDRAAPRFWSFITSGRWDMALAELRAFGDAGRDEGGKPRSSHRRLQEAELWDEALPELLQLGTG